MDSNESEWYNVVKMDHNLIFSGRCAGLELVDSLKDSALKQAPSEFSGLRMRDGPPTEGA